MEEKLKQIILFGTDKMDFLSKILTVQLSEKNYKEFTENEKIAVIQKIKFFTKAKEMVEMLDYFKWEE